MKPIMPWLDLLKDVHATDFPARRHRIDALMQSAAQPSPIAAHLLAEAYVEACRLEDDAIAYWSFSEVEQAQCGLGPLWRRPGSLPGAWHGN